MKKLTAILMTCTMLICAAASCGETKEKDKESSSKKSETTTVAETTEDKDDEESDDEKKSDDDEKSDDEKKSDDDEKSDDEKKSDDDEKSDDKKSDDKKSDDDKDAGKPASEDMISEVNEMIYKFASSMLDKKTDDAIACMYPAELIKAMKEADDYENWAEDALEEDDEGKLIEASAQDVKELSQKALSGAANYFNLFMEMEGKEAGNFIVEKGCSFKLDIKSEVNGERDDMNEDACAVYIKGDGWLLIPVGEEELEEMSEVENPLG
ncbi:hypothetical protein [Ruminococcus flavefaciens]|uniref:hypothetical protein n=1 Tax=Ruminococcus flavefaciens TaxID=1265 RepID=UPI00048D17AB|nr:hypothetical protein [Ruminococcus flavefaciens]